MKTIPVGNLTLAYQVQGHGPDVLLIHGWLGSCRIWESTMVTLSGAGYRCWALDLPGFGASSRPEPQWYTLDNLSDIAAQFASACGLSRVRLIGHSMGGMLALHLAAERPALVERLVAVNPVVSGQISPLAERMVVGKLGQWLEARSEPLWTLVAMGSRLLAAEPWIQHRPAMQRNLEDAARCSGSATFGALRSVLQTNLSDRLRRVRAETLIVAGTHDRTVPPREAQLAVRCVPKARLVMLPGTRHSPMDERSPAFSQIVLDFLHEERRLPADP